jgi:hypothetical protein
MNEWCTYNLGGKDLTYHRHTQASDFRKVTVFVDVLRKEKVPEGDISIMKITTTLLVICKYSLGFFCCLYVSMTSS